MAKKIISLKNGDTLYIKSKTNKIKERWCRYCGAKMIQKTHQIHPVLPMNSRDGSLINVSCTRLVCPNFITPYSGHEEKYYIKTDKGLYVVDREYADDLDFADY